MNFFPLQLLPPVHARIAVVLESVSGTNEQNADREDSNEGKRKTRETTPKIGVDTKHSQVMSTNWTRKVPKTLIMECVRANRSLACDMAVCPFRFCFHFPKEFGSCENMGIVREACGVLCMKFFKGNVYTSVLEEAVQKPRNSIQHFWHIVLWMCANSGVFASFAF